MNTHNIGFLEEIRKICFGYPSLSGAIVHDVFSWRNKKNVSIILLTKKYLMISKAV